MKLSTILGMCVALGAPSLARANPSASRTSTSATAMSPDDLELARYLEVLEEYELLERMDMVSLLAALEDEE